MENTKDYYESNYYCFNCACVSKVQIPKGTTIWDFFKKHTCLICGCVGLEGSEKFKNGTKNLPF